MAVIERSGILHLEEVALPDVADAVGTPVYCYSTAALLAAFRGYTEALAGLDAQVCFALKANANLAVLRTLARAGAGADVVSEGELRRALMAGVEPQRIIFSGVGKSPAELAAALDARIHQFNVESADELERLAAIAGERRVTAPVALRVNPDVDARTHAKITTGRKENKFGIDIAQATAVYRRAQALPGIEPVGIAVHIGSQLTELEPFRAAYARLAGLVRELRAEGFAVPRLDLGGGLGIADGVVEPPPVGAYAAVVRSTVGSLGCALTIEPGRSIAGPAGLLLARVMYVKRGVSRDFLVLDAAMNDLIRPALYDAVHPIRPVRASRDDAAPMRYDVVGPVCETGDTFARDYPLPALVAGDLVVLEHCGAYGSVMASTYNGRPLVPEVLVTGERFALARKRPSFEETVAWEAMPPWL